MSLIGTLRARWNTTNWEELLRCLGEKFPGKKASGQGEGLLLTLGKDLNERALKLSEKDLDSVAHGSEAEKVETCLETIELSNEEKSALFNWEDAAIL